MTDKVTETVQQEVISEPKDLKPTEEVKVVTQTTDGSGVKQIKSLIKLTSFTDWRDLTRFILTQISLLQK